MDWQDIESLKTLLGTALGSQVAQFGVAFSIAAWIHAGRVRKELAAQLSPMTTAINNLSQALTEGLSDHSERIEKVENLANQLKDRIQKGGL